MPVTIGGSGPITGVTSINTSVSDTELGYLDGVTSALQTQINAKPTGTTGVWVDYTPTVSAQTGTITTSSATGAYCQIGKLVHVRMTITITNKGTAQGHIQTNYPVTPRAVQTSGYGAEYQVAGWGLRVHGDSTTIFIRKYDNTDAFAAGNGAIYQVDLTYEAA